MEKCADPEAPKEKCKAYIAEQNVRTAAIGSNWNVWNAPSELLPLVDTRGKK